MGSNGVTSRLPDKHSGHFDQCYSFLFLPVLQLHMVELIVLNLLHRFSEIEHSIRGEDLLSKCNKMAPNL